VFAPRYRQASLYSFLNMRDDARDARVFAYGDVSAAFKAYLTRFNQGRPIVIAGVEQGGTLVSRLAREAAADPALKSRLVAVYLIDVPVPQSEYASDAILPACNARAQAGCVVGWVQVFADEDGLARHILNRALAWNRAGGLEAFDGPALCVNPLTGSIAAPRAPAQSNLGAANATGLEWGVRPAFLSHEVSAECRDGVLWVSRPKSPTLRSSGSWADQKKAPDYNLFYADIEADVKARATAYEASADKASPSSR
jgi:hypothetical protein